LPTGRQGSPKPACGRQGQRDFVFFNYLKIAVYREAGFEEKEGRNEKKSVCEAITKIKIFL
jgi:hypothetical protein